MAINLNRDPLDLDLAELALEEQAPRLRYGGATFDAWIAHYGGDDSPHPTRSTGADEVRYAEESEDL